MIEPKSKSLRKNSGNENCNSAKKGFSTILLASCMVLSGFPLCNFRRIPVILSSKSTKTKCQTPFVHGPSIRESVGYSRGKKNTPIRWFISHMGQFASMRNFSFFDFVQAPTVLLELQRMFTDIFTKSKWYRICTIYHGRVAE